MINVPLGRAFDKKNACSVIVLLLAIVLYFVPSILLISSFFPLQTYLGVCGCVCLYTFLYVAMSSAINLFKLCN